MRKLASIQEIVDIRPIEGADKIECATVLGWETVVKVGEFKVGDKCVFFEIDALLPNEDRYSFLGEPRKEYNGYRLKTVKLRGKISQGLALPLSEYDLPQNIEIDTDLTDTLTIGKYEPPAPQEEGAKQSDKVWEISKTDETRYQSAPRLLTEIQGKSYYGSVKLDGTSMTVILNINENGEPEVNVCGRNICYMESEHNKYWAIVHKYDLKNKILDHYAKTGERLAFQGELCGPKIQGNKLGLKENDWFVFNVFEANGQEEFTPAIFPVALSTTRLFGMDFVPVAYIGETYDYKKEDLQGLTNIKYNKYFPGADPKQNIEGIVFRTTDMSVSFKVISNEFLLKGGE